MSRHARTGDGTAWLVADGAEPTGFHCYWYTGHAEDHMVEHAHLLGATAAVAWGRQRTPRVRIRTADARSSWAGAAPRPVGITNTWSDLDPPTAAPALRQCARCRGMFPGDRALPPGLDTGWWACPPCRDLLIGPGAAPAPWTSKAAIAVR